MSNEISQAEPVEIITPEAEVQETVPEGDAPAEPQTEKPLTTEDYRRIAREEATKVAQSQVAKGENRINQRIQEKFGALEESKGVLKLSDEQVQQARRDIVTDAYSEPAAQSQAGAQSPVDGNPIQVLNGYLGAVFEEVGVVVTANDPEFKKLQDAIDEAWTIDGPQGLVKVQRAAIKAAESKAARLEAQKKNAAARVAGGGEGSTSDPSNISNITDAKELYRLGEKKVGGGK